MNMSQLQELADRAVRHAMDSRVQYCDARAEQQERHSVLIRNGDIEHIKIDYDGGIGIRLIKDGSWSFCSITSPDSIEDIKNSIDDAIKSSVYNAKDKRNRIDLHPISAVRHTANYTVLDKPDMDKIVNIGFECSKIISDAPRIINSVVNPTYTTNSKYFVNGEGSKITQNFTDVTMSMSATAHESGVTQSVNITEGGRGGLEQITNNNKIQQCSQDIALKASQLVADAKPMKEEKDATVVMNPDFVALLAHEILGHPSEADRVLGREMAWAGGAWWKNMIGEEIGTTELNVFDDPTIKDSLGWYSHDDEGVKTKRTKLIEDGVLKNHMQSRETAQIFDAVPTGNMRAASYRFMPLIRMACTCIDNGSWDAAEIVKDVKDGYYISNMKVPSIDMKRFNWSISCQYAQKIKDGQITDLLKDVIVVGTAPKFFKSIDACGNDFTIRPIINCGKGDPMQSMIMGNGGPTIRGTATVRGAAG